MVNERLKNKNILFTSNTLQFLISYKYDLAKKLLFEGANIFFGAPKANNENLYKKLIQNNIRFLKTSTKRKGLSALIKSFLLYKKFLSQNKQALIISHTVYLNIIGIFTFVLFNNSNNKLYVFVSGFGPSRIRNSLRYRLLGRIYLTVLRHFSSYKNISIFALNQDDRNLIQDYMPKRNIFLIREGGLTDNELNLSYRDVNATLRERIRIGYFGRFLLEKGLSEYIELIRISRDIGLKFDFCIAGTEDLDNTSSLSADFLKSLESENVLIEINPNYENFFKAIDIILFPSFREGHPLYLFRSMAYGVVPIVYNYPGNTVDVIDRYNGLISTPSSVSGLLSKLIECDKDRNFLKRLSDNAVDYAKKFSQDKINNNFVELICKDLKLEGN